MAQPDGLNTLAEVQATLGLLNVRSQVLCEAVGEATAALCELAECAAARGEFELARQALDAADSVGEKVRAMAVITGAVDAET